MRLAAEHDVDLVLVDATPGLLETGHPDPDLAPMPVLRPPDRGNVEAGSGLLLDRLPRLRLSGSERGFRA